MTKHYEMQFKIHQAIDGLITKRVLENGEELDMNFLILELTGKYPIGEKTITKRVDLHVKVNKGLRLVDDKLFFVGGEE